MSAEPSILVTKPRQLPAAAKKQLREAGIIVVEVDKPDEVRFMRPHAELSSTEMLVVAMRAIHRHGGVAHNYLGEEMAKAIIAKTAKPTA